MKDLNWMILKSQVRPTNKSVMESIVSWWFPYSKLVGAGNPSITYQWTPTTGLSDPNIPNPIATPTTPIIYKVVSTLQIMA